MELEIYTWQVLQLCNSKSFLAFFASVFFSCILLADMISITDYNTVISKNSARTLNLKNS